MEIQFDSTKREATLLNRGLDFARADEVFNQEWLVRKDERFDYDEQRFISYGVLDSRWVVLVWTPRGTACRIISMRYAHEREISHFEQGLG